MKLNREKGTSFNDVLGKRNRSWGLVWLHALQCIDKSRDRVRDQCAPKGQEEQTGAQEGEEGKGA